MKQTFKLAGHKLTLIVPADTMTSFLAFAMYLEEFPFDGAKVTPLATTGVEFDAQLIEVTVWPTSVTQFVREFSIGFRYDVGAEDRR